MSNKWVVFVAVLWVLLAAASAAATVSSDQLDQWRTLSSLHKVDDHPLYVMTYYGDYDFEKSLLADTQWQPSYLEMACGWACTCFSSFNEEGAPLFGRNFDWHDHPALLLFTDPPDGYASVSMVDIAYLGFGRGDPSWGARRRLLQAPYMPFDGLNERGLVVGMMAVSEADAPHDPQKVTLDSLQAIRLLLDDAQDVDEAISLLDNYNIAWDGGPPLHYLIADVAGHSAVVEFVDGQMEVLRNEQPWQVATNFVISVAMPEGASSGCWRYNRAYQTLQGTSGSLSPQEAMALLKNVSQSSTIWSIVYGLGSGDVQVVMNREYDQVHTFKLGR